MTAPILVITGPSGAGKTTVAKLVAAAFNLSTYIRTDDFMPFIVNGWVEPSLPEASHQNHVLGGAMGAAAIQFAVGGYTVIVDGLVFRDGLDGMAEMCARRAVVLHCAVLRPDLSTCLARVRQRRPGDADDPEPIARLHTRFADLGDYERNVIDTTGSPIQIASTLLSAYSAGRLRVG